MGKELLDVIMPVEYYQIKKNGEWEWDDLGRTAYEVDLSKFHNLPTDEDKIRASLFPFYYAQGLYVFGYHETEQALEHAIACIRSRFKTAPPLEPQLSLDLKDPTSSKTVYTLSPKGKRIKVHLHPLGTVPTSND